jgi:cell division septation protein DedD
VGQLRSRQHRAFTIPAEIPERGTHWRVRIGPFKSMREAEQYREQFEEQEGMHTFVVRERQESDHG